ncbi:MAG: Xylose isomerase domain protein barrel [Phycisphaerales bacterium]|nr:Xylose isomerase domain protein barrel [Phycisphaerales bacterium]
MKLSVMTLGCPSWDLETVIRRVAEYGYDGIDFRGVGDQLDVTRLPAFTTDAATTRRLLADHGLSVSGISSSIRVCDPALHAESLDEAKRTIDAALAVGAPNIRVFGEGRPDVDGYAVAARAGVDCMQAILALPDAARLR